MPEDPARPARLVRPPVEGEHAPVRRVVRDTDHGPGSQVGGDVDIDTGVVHLAAVGHRSLIELQQLVAVEQTRDVAGHIGRGSLTVRRTRTTRRAGRCGRAGRPGRGAGRRRAAGHPPSGRPPRSARSGRYAGAEHGGDAVQRYIRIGVDREPQAADRLGGGQGPRPAGTPSPSGRCG